MWVLINAEHYIYSIMVIVQNNFSSLKILCGEFPGSPVVRTRHFHCKSPDLIPVGELRSQEPHSMVKKTREKASFLFHLLNTPSENLTINDLYLSLVLLFPEFHIFKNIVHMPFQTYFFHLAMCI